MSHRSFAHSLYGPFALLLILWAPLAGAVLPVTVGYQAYLSNANGTPVDETVTIQFRLYTAPVGGAPIWSETQSVAVDTGLLSVELGTVVPFSLPDDFDTPVYLGVEIGGDGEMSPRRAFSVTGYAVQSYNAAQLDGDDPVVYDQSAHASNTSSNPHQVTAAQVGAATPVDINSHAADAAAHHAKTTSFVELDGQAADAQLPASIARDSEITWGNLADIPAGFADGVDDNTDTNAGTLCPNGAYLAGDGSCSPSDSSGACAAGAVCKGGHGHAGGDITGGSIDLGTGEYTHSVRTGYLHIAGAALTSSNATFNYVASSTGYVRPSGATTQFTGYAPLDLPQGATVTAVTVYAYDNSSAPTTQNWYCGVARRPLISTGATVILERNFNIEWSASSNVRATTQTGGTHVIDKSSNAYWLRAGVTNTDGSSAYRHYGCRVAYTYSNTNP